MVEAIFTADCDEITTKEMFQWDRGQYLKIECAELPESYEVHFAPRGDKKALIMEVEANEGIAVVGIPDVLFQQKNDVRVWVYFVNGTEGRTEKVINIPVRPRPRPETVVVGGGGTVSLQIKTANENGIVTPDEDYVGLARVFVDLDLAGIAELLGGNVSDTTSDIKTQEQALIDASNAKMGNVYTNLTDGVNALIEGYAQNGDIADIEGMYTVRFWRGGTEISRCYTAYTNGVQAPIHAGGSSMKYSETDGGSGAVDFPYYPTKNTDLYAILTLVKLPEPYHSYMIVYDDTSTNLIKWSIRLFRSDKLSCNGLGGRLFIDGQGSSFLHIYGFDTLEDAVNGLLAYCEDGTISSGKSETASYLEMRAYYFDSPYYLSHDVFKDTTYADILVEANPYMG